MVNNGIELILGAKRDSVYGPVIMIGIGGIFVELYKDVVFRVLPIDFADAQEMISELKGIKLLKGFRNLPSLNLRKLAKIILNFSYLIAENSNILEIDLNPLIWTHDTNEPVIVDCRMTEVLNLQDDNN
jgi:hypothetical protein